MPSAGGRARASADCRKWCDVQRLRRSQGKDRPWALDTLPLIFPPRNGQTSPPASSSAPVCSMRCSAICMVRSVCCRKARFRPRSRSDIPTSRGRVMAPCRAVSAGSMCTPPILRVHTMVAGGCSAIARRHLPALAMRSKIVASCRVSLPICSTIMNVRPLTGAFAALRDALLGDVDDGEAPLAVVLTPGPFNETYFEHAYLARQLGFALVEGGDLTVRGDTLYPEDTRRAASRPCGGATSRR